MATKGQKLATAGAAFLIAEPALAFAHTGPLGTIVALAAGAAAYAYADDLAKMVGGREGYSLPASTQAAGKPSLAYRLLNGKSTRGTAQEEPAADDQAQSNPTDTKQSDAHQELDPLFQIKPQHDDNSIKRLTIEQIVKNTTLNSYRIWIGRSLTDPEHKAVQISFYKQHFRFMGASQCGKSSMVAAFLDIVTQTHAPKHVQIALLDSEDQTSRLFAHLPHVAAIKRDGQRIRLCARTSDEVLERLINVVEIMRYRYGLPIEQVRALPILLVYLEEFLALKNEFKSRVDTSKTKSQHEQEKAQSDYATLVYCIETLCQQGLKARVQLLLCAQVEYADDDFKEALVNVGCGFAFCVRPTAAASAGFQNGPLIRRNAREKKFGQAVVETPDCNDLVLAPEYDREQRLLEWQQQHDGNHFPTTSYASDTATSAPTSQDTRVEVEGNRATGPGKQSEVAAPLPQLSELEMRVGRLFFQEKAKLSDIVKELYPDVSGGNPYIRATTEVNEALRRYAEYMQHRSLQAVREEGEV